MEQTWNWVIYEPPKTNFSQKSWFGEIVFKDADTKNRYHPERNICMRDVKDLTKKEDSIAVDWATPLFHKKIELGQDRKGHIGIVYETVPQMGGDYKVRLFGIIELWRESE